MRTIPSTAKEHAERLRELLLALGRRRGGLRDPIFTALEEIQLTAPQIHAVLWCGHDGPLTMGEIAWRLGVSDKTVTGLVDRLEKAGHVKRERDTQDRRVVRARLTRKGEVTFKKARDAFFQQIIHLVTLLDPPDREDLFRIVAKLVDRLAQVPGAAAALSKQAQEHV